MTTDGDGFKAITYKRSKNRGKPLSNIHHHDLTIKLDQEEALSRIESAKLEISSSDLFDSAAASLREGLVALENPAVEEIICFGLGRIGECVISRYQFAFLLCLRDLYTTKVKVYDPIFTEIDAELIKHFGCEVLRENFEAKCKVREHTIFYMPHCPKQLSNNLLWANWGLNLSRCVIISNSFTSIIEKTPRRILCKTGEFIEKIAPYVSELAIFNTFKYFEIFNDTAIHVFPWRSINNLPDEFWTFCSEPVYSDDDLEFIRKH